MLIRRNDNRSKKATLITSIMKPLTNNQISLMTEKYYWRVMKWKQDLKSFLLREKSAKLN